MSSDAEGVALTHAEYEALLEKAKAAVRTEMMRARHNYDVTTARIARAVLDAVLPGLEETLWREGSMHRLFDAARAQAQADADVEHQEGVASVRREIADDLRAQSLRIRAAWTRHNSGRDLGRQTERRRDLRQWADAYEAAANRVEGRHRQ